MLARPRAPIVQRLGVAFVLTVAAGLALRLFRMIDLHAVDLLFYDQIELYENFVRGANAWELFRFQLGPHRQGLPFLATRLLAALTDWNARADAFLVYAWVVVACALALGLRVRLAGRLRPSDVAIPLLLFTPAQYGIFLHTPNASHCAGPVVLILLCCHALLIERARLRQAALVVLDFFLVHTGFALFAGGIVPLLLARSAWVDRRDGRTRDAAWALAAALLCLAWIGVFLIGYRTRGGLDAIIEPFEPTRHATYVALMFANLFGLKDPGTTTVVIGAAIASLVAAVCIGSLLRLLGVPRREPATAVQHATPAIRDDAAAAIVFLLTAFTLLYCAATAVGRIQLGMSGAQSSRYVPLVAPAILGVLLALARLEWMRIRAVLGLLSVAALVAATFPMRPLEADFMERLAQRKRSWVASYVQTGSVVAANQAARLNIDPFRDPRATTEKTFAYLRAHRKSFFADR